ncbi:hypothetical protein EJB05_15792, partial [Eragrostis curvula]
MWTQVGGDSLAGSARRSGGLLRLPHSGATPLPWRQRSRCLPPALISGTPWMRCYGAGKDYEIPLHLIQQKPSCQLSRERTWDKLKIGNQCSLLCSFAEVEVAREYSIVGQHKLDSKGRVGYGRGVCGYRLVYQQFQT